MGKVRKLQKHYEGGLGAGAQEGRKKITTNKTVIGRKVDGYHQWNKTQCCRASHRCDCSGSLMHVDTLHGSPTHLEKAEYGSNSKARFLDTQPNWVHSYFSDTTRQMVFQQS